MSHVAEMVEKQLDDLRNWVGTQFSTIHGELRGIGEALSGLVRLEERYAGQNKHLSRLDSGHDDHEKRLRQLETAFAAGAVRVGMNERLIWMGVSLAIGLLGYFLRGDL